VESLERDAPEVLIPAEPTENSFEPLNWILHEVLSVIPHYWDEDDVDKNLIALTHVCRDWRDMFVSASSLWTRLDFVDIDKTRTYIERSRSSPLKIHLKDDKFTEDAFALVIPHIPRLESLIICGETLPSLLKYFRCNKPLLEKLDIEIHTTSKPFLGSALFDSDLSSLRELRLAGVIAHFPRANLPNLRVVEFESGPQPDTITKILDFLESAPLLHTVLLRCILPPSSDAPPNRMIFLHHLKVFAIQSFQRYSILLQHLHIPTGASLVISKSSLQGEVKYLAGRFPNLSNLSDITTVDLLFGSKEKSVRFIGPSGSLRVLPRCTQDSTWNDFETFCSLDHPMLSTIQRLSISNWNHQKLDETERLKIHQTLSSANDLRTLVLINCHSRAFILALDPGKDTFDPVPCPGMEKIFFYVEYCFPSDIEALINMLENRASRGVKLPSIMLVDLGDSWQREELSRLREHVTHVEYRVNWD
jgi:hypothetical protein